MRKQMQNEIEPTRNRNETNANSNWNASDIEVKAKLHGRANELNPFPTQTSYPTFAGYIYDTGMQSEF